MHLALYQPDIPQNTGAAMRLCACLGLTLDIIEPCGFLWNDKKIRRSGMDYTESVSLTRHTSWEKFCDTYQGKQRIILMTTKASVPYHNIDFRADDILLAGRESAGVPDNVHDAADERIMIPMHAGQRSMNVINSASFILGYALPQTNGLIS